ncbi:MAG: capsular polysaccharide biosynthesis protein CapF [Clostridia bacterium]
MKILITGAGGFMGRNLIARLNEQGNHEIFAFELDTPRERLEEYCAECDFVYHLAGVNRPKEQDEFMAGNFGFTDVLLQTLNKRHNTCPIMLSSSTQAALPNLYGKSKKAGEELMFRYAERTGATVYVFRFPNVFGKWSCPNYNSAIATFCYNIARDLPITINDSTTVMRLVYIDDLMDALIALLDGKTRRDGDFCTVAVTHTATLGHIAETIESFRASRENLSVADQSDLLTKKLYATYLSFLPEEGFAYPLTMHADARGSFTEFLRTPDRGQISVNVAKPGVVKGNHWHHTKNEKFLVVSGKGVIRFRKIDADEVIVYHVSGEFPTSVDIPIGYTHNIENTGTTDLVTVMWASEPFDPKHPDTIHLEVE